jgi:hypothetical protein
MDICCAAVRAAAAFANTLTVNEDEVRANSDEDKPNRKGRTKRHKKNIMSNDVLLGRVTQKVQKFGNRPKIAKFNAMIVDGGGGLAQLQALCDISSAEEIFVPYSLEDNHLRPHYTHLPNQTDGTVFKQWFAGNPDIRVPMEVNVSNWHFGLPNNPLEGGL